MSTIEDLGARAGEAARREASSIAAAMTRPTDTTVHVVPATSPTRRRALVVAIAAVGVAAAAVSVFVLARDDDSARIGPAPVPTIEPEPSTSPTTDSTSPATTAVPTTTPSTSPSVEPTPTTDPLSTLMPGTTTESCVNDAVPPPKLIDGSTAGDASVTNAPTGTSVQWGSPAAGTNVTQLLGPLVGREYFDIVGFGDQFVVDEPFEAAVVPVGDPPLGEITIDIGEFGSGCVRRYFIGPGVELADAVDFARAWVGALAALPQMQFVEPLPASIRPPVPISAVRYTDGDASPQLYEIRSDGVDAEPVRLLDVGSRAEHLSVLADGRVIRPASNANTNGRCENVPVTIASGADAEPLHPDLPTARSLAATPAGVVIASRDVCPDGTRWGDPGTRWELVRLDLTDPEPRVEVLMTREPDPSLVLATFPEGVIALGDSPISSISDDGRHAALISAYNSEQARYDIVRLGTTAEPAAVGSACETPGDIVGPPAFIGDDRVVVARLCLGSGGPDGQSDHTLIETVALDSGDVIESVDLGRALSAYTRTLALSVLSTEAGTWSIASWNDDVEASTEAVIVHDGQIGVLSRPGFDGFAFRSEEFGFGERPSTGDAG